MSNESTWRILFLMSWLARVAMMPLAAHWGLVGVAALMGAPLDCAADYTQWFVAALAIGCMGLLAVFGRDSRVSLRMNRGPDAMLRHSAVVIGAGILSGAGGAWLLIAGSRDAGLWASGLGLLAVILETSALLGSTYVRALALRS